MFRFWEFVIYFNVNFNVLKQIYCALVGVIKRLGKSKCVVQLWKLGKSHSLTQWDILTYFVASYLCSSDYSRLVSISYEYPPLANVSKHHSKSAFYSTPLTCAEWDDSLPFSGASSIPLCYVLFPATLPHKLFFHPPSLHLATYFLVYLSILLFPNSYIILFWELYFLPFSVHAQTNVTYLTLLPLL